MPEEKCLRCQGTGRDPEFHVEQCRVCKGSGEKQPDIVLDVQNIRIEFGIKDILGGKIRPTIT